MKDMKKIFNIKKKFCFLLCVTLTVSLLLGCQSNRKEAVTKTGFYFDTVISITLYGQDKEPYIDRCFEMARTYESYFSTTIEDSDVSRINQHPGEAVTVHPETAELIQKGLSYYSVSEGRFDITIGALSSLWNFSDSSGKIPEHSKIEDALQTVNASSVLVDGDQVTLTSEGTKIDLGGIAKGYIADQMKSYLKEEGITEGTINLGGNVLVLGPKEHQETTTYSIGIQKPFSEDGSAIAVIKITDESVVTSGIYQRYFKQNGTIYHHILDSSTGYPYDNGLASVTIINQSSVDGDALSTTCFMLGLEKGMELAESLENTEAIFITTDNEIYYTSGMGTIIPFEILN